MTRPDPARGAPARGRAALAGAERRVTRPAALAALAASLAAALASPGRAEPAGALRERALAVARSHVGRPYADDCSGFVLAVWRAAGVRPKLGAARSRSESLHLASRRVESARPGDLAFFHDTYDRNRDGRANDPYTHVGIVEAVRGTTVTVLHRASRRVERVRMDLSRPADPARNDPVRQRRRGEPASLRVLSGQLFAGFGTLPGT